jgi:sortase A
MFSHLLRLMEGIVVIAFLAIIGYGSLTMVRLNKVAKSNWELPSMTPTPLIQARILPGGNPPTNAGEKPLQRIVQLPQHLQTFFQSFVNIQVPTPATKQAVRIQIPVLSIDAPIVQGDEEEQLKKGVGQHPGTANPGDVGNVVLSGHNDTYGEVFRYLDKLKTGDQIIIYTFTRSYTYIVEGWTLVEPDQVDVMAPTTYQSVTLISCYPYLVDNKRIIVKARIQNNT